MFIKLLLVYHKYNEKNLYYYFLFFCCLYILFCNSKCFLHIKCIIVYTFLKLWNYEILRKLHLWCILEFITVWILCKKYVNAIYFYVFQFYLGILLYTVQSGVEVIKLCSVLGAQKSCSKHKIRHFDWLILESEYKNRARKFYDRKARYILLLFLRWSLTIQNHFSWISIVGYNIV